MAKWNSYTPISGANVADADLLPYSDEGEAVGSKSKVASIATLRTVLAGASNVTTTDPGVGDDSADGYRAGSIWLNTTDGGVFICEDASAGAAVWTEFTPAGGTGDVVGPASAVDDRIVTFNGTTGKLVQDGGYTIAELAAIPVSINAQTGTTYTLVLADAGKLVTLSNAGAITLTVPTNASVAFPVGTVIALQQLGAGAISVAGATGVAINGTTPGSESITDGQYTSTATLTKHATDTWTLTGAVA